MPDRDKLARLITAKELGGNLICLASVGSTNDYLKSRAGLFAHGTAVLADEQTAGRGRRGNVWVSCKGGVLAVSVLLKMGESLPDPALTLACGLAAARALNALCGEGFLIKWPNDIVFAGKKVCGVLCESVIEKPQSFLVCGFGVNIGQSSGFFEEAGLPHAASLKMATGAAPGCEETAAAILNELDEIYEKYKLDGPDALLAEYRDLCVTLGREVRVLLPGGERTGTALSVEPDGSLLVAAGNENVRVNAGEVSVRGVMGYV